MSRTDPPDRRDVRPWDRDSKQDRVWWQRRFRRGVRQALDDRDETRGERRWRRTGGWLSG